MKSKFLMKIFAAVLYVCVCSGCSLISPSVPDINYYDLTFSGSERLTVPYLVVYRNFQNISPVKMNLIYSESNYLQALDQYNFWTQSPENMLQRYLLNAVKSDTKAARQVIVTLSVYEFRFDIVHRPFPRPCRQPGQSVRHTKPQHGCGHPRDRGCSFPLRPAAGGLPPGSDILCSSHRLQSQSILGSVKLRIDAALLEQFLMAAAFCNVAVCNGYNPVGISDGA